MSKIKNLMQEIGLDYIELDQQGNIKTLRGKGKASIFKKKVNKFGGSGHIILPVDTVGKTCTIIIEEKQ